MEFTSSLNIKTIFNPNFMAWSKECKVLLRFLYDIYMRSERWPLIVRAIEYPFDDFVILIDILFNITNNALETGLNLIHESLQRRCSVL